MKLFFIFALQVIVIVFQKNAFSVIIHQKYVVISYKESVCLPFYSDTTQWKFRLCREPTLKETIDYVISLYTADRFWKLTPVHLEWMSLLYQALWLFLHYDQNIQSDDFILGNRPIGISKILTMVYQNSHYLYVLSNHHYAVLCTCMNILQSVKSVKYCSVLFYSFLFFFNKEQQQHPFDIV